MPGNIICYLIATVDKVTYLKVVNFKKQRLTYQNLAG